MIDRMEEIKDKVDGDIFPTGSMGEDCQWLLGYAEYLEKQMAPAVKMTVNYVEMKPDDPETNQHLQLVIEKPDTLPEWVKSGAEVLIMPILKREEGNPA